MLIIYELGVHLERGEKLLDNNYHDQPMSSLWDSIESLRCCHVMQSLFSRFIRDSMCLRPCVPQKDPVFSLRKEEGSDTLYLCVFDGVPESCRAMHRSGYLI